MHTVFFEVVSPTVHHLLEPFDRYLAIGKLIEQFHELTVTAYESFLLFHKLNE